MAEADDDLEPIPLSPGAPPAEKVARAVAVRDRFLLALAIVVAVAIVALAVQLRAIARDTAHEADCSEALVAMVSASGPASVGEQRERIEAQLRSCLGPDVTLPGFDD